MTLQGLAHDTGVTAMDVAKRLLDFGIHPPTMYFPLIVHEALMVEPTETEPGDPGPGGPGLPDHPGRGQGRPGEPPPCPPPLRHWPAGRGDRRPPPGACGTTSGPRKAEESPRRCFAYPICAHRGGHRPPAQPGPEATLLHQVRPGEEILLPVAEPAHRGHRAQPTRDQRMPDPGSGSRRRTSCPPSVRVVGRFTTTWGT